MGTYSVELVEEEEYPIDTGIFVEGEPMTAIGRRPRVVEHTGHLDVEGGALVFSPGPFEQPTIGYASGAWLRFEKKEN